jgi:alpha-tubulin suppressor-like RCC1 family protein
MHTCGVAQGGAAFCWGSNSGGQLGNAELVLAAGPVPVSGSISFTSLTAGGEHTCGLDATGAAWCWGFNWYGQLGNQSWTTSEVPVRVAGGHAFLALDAGQDHTCGITGSGAIYCWGANNFGQLGRGTQGYMTVPVAVAAATVAAADGEFAPRRLAADPRALAGSGRGLRPVPSRYVRPGR